VVAFQCLMAWLVRDMAWWKVVALAYLVGGSASQNLFCAQHELSHFLAHRRLGVNRALSLLSNCPLVVPMATAFRKYHQEHHSHLVRARPCPCSQDVKTALLPPPGLRTQAQDLSVPGAASRLAGLRVCGGQGRGGRGLFDNLGGAGPLLRCQPPCGCLGERGRSVRWADLRRTAPALGRRGRQGAGRRSRAAVLSAGR